MVGLFLDHKHLGREDEPVEGRVVHIPGRSPFADRRRHSAAGNPSGEQTQRLAQILLDPQSGLKTLAAATAASSAAEMSPRGMELKRATAWVDEKMLVNSSPASEASRAVGSTREDSRRRISGSRPGWAGKPRIGKERDRVQFAEQQDPRFAEAVAERYILFHQIEPLSSLHLGSPVSALRPDKSKQVTGAPKPGGNRPGIAELDRQLTKLVLGVAMMRPAQQFAVPNQISRKLQECHAMRIATFRAKRFPEKRCRRPAIPGPQL